MSQLRDAALAYAEAGWPVFPCIPGRKTPLTANGFHDATTDEDQILAWWEQTPNANIGLPGGGFIAIDDDGGVAAWLEGQAEKLHGLSSGPISVTPSGGRHYFFRQPDPPRWRCSAGDLAKDVDTRGVGGYVVAPPSHADGARYKWLPGCELEEADELPEPPAWLADELDSLNRSRSRSTTAAKGARRDTGLEAGDDDEEIISGRRNVALARLAGHMREVGVGLPGIAAALIAENETRCKPPLGEREVLHVAQSIASYPPHQVMEQWRMGIDVAMIPWNGGAIELDDEPADDSRDPGPFPAELLDVPGFVGAYVRWGLSRQRRPQPTLTLLAALCFQGALAARKVCDDGGCRTGLFAVGVCESGAGKTAVLKRQHEMLDCAGYGTRQMGKDSLIGSGRFMSDSGLANEVAAHPNRFFQVDEFGELLAAMADSRNRHTHAISSTLNELWSVADTVWTGRAYADESKSKSIDRPCITVLGMVQPIHWQRSLTDGMLTDGFLARLITLSGDPLPDRGPMDGPRLAPGELVDHVTAWSEASAGNLADVLGDPVTVPWSPEAVAVLAREGELIDAIRAAPQPSYERSCWARVEEKACRLALIYACSESADLDELEISGAAMEWGFALARYSTNWVLHDIEQHRTEGLFDERRQRVLAALRAQPLKAMRRGKLIRRLKSWEAQTRRTVLDSMCSAGELHIYVERTGKAGKPPEWVALAEGAQLAGRPVNWERKSCLEW